MTTGPARLRSLLFAPASRPDVLAKLPRSTPDGVVIDLEDAVPPTGKVEARAHGPRRRRPSSATTHPEIAVYVRVNAVPTEWFAADVTAGVAPEIAGIVVPKLESVEQVATVVEALARGRPRAPARGRRDRDRARRRAARRAVRAARWRSATSAPRTSSPTWAACARASSTEVLYARSRVALAARIAGVLALDQVVTTLDDDEHFLADAAAGARASGTAASSASTRRR